jgi:O-antigen/teichoic acid export membrane protein
LLLAGPGLFALVFGDPWRISGEYARLLAPMFLVQFAIMPLSQTLNALERQDYQLVWDGARLGLVVLTLLLANTLGVSASVSIAFYGAVMFAAYLGLAVISERAIVARFPDG